VKFATLAIFAAVALLAHTQALACRQLIPSAKEKYSDVVVDGTAHCLERSGICKLKIAKVIKGDAALTDVVIDISVTDAPPKPDEGDAVITLRCPQTFEPWQAVTMGRFYLRGSVETGYIAAHPIDAVDTAPE
jgi:hypothetical protein